MEIIENYGRVNEVMTTNNLEKYNKFIENEYLKNSDFIKEIEYMLDSHETENSNANVDESSFSGRKLRATDKLLKYIALEKTINPTLRELYKNNQLYFHDMDSYTIGQHNCLFVDLYDVLSRGFNTRNGGARPPKTISTAYQLVAVIFQCESQCQFGGVGSAAFDRELAPFVAKSFIKHFNKALKNYNRYNGTNITFSNRVKTIEKGLNIYNIRNGLLDTYNTIHKYAMEDLIEELKQASEGLVHNLVLLQSRCGGQLPFTSINLGLDTSKEGRLITEYLFKAVLNGVGHNYKTPVFPILIFRHKKGINAYKGEPNYDLKCLAIRCLSSRIYPNFVNCDTTYFESDGTPHGEMATMG